MLGQPGHELSCWPVSCVARARLDWRVCEDVEARGLSLRIGTAGDYSCSELKSILMRLLRESWQESMMAARVI